MGNVVQRAWVVPSVQASDWSARRRRGNSRLRLPALRGAASGKRPPSNGSGVEVSAGCQRQRSLSTPWEGLGPRSGLHGSCSRRPGGPAHLPTGPARWLSLHTGLSSPSTPLRGAGPGTSSWNTSLLPSPLGNRPRSSSIPRVGPVSGLVSGPSRWACFTADPQGRDAVAIPRLTQRGASAPFFLAFAFRFYMHGPG